MEHNMEAINCLVNFMACAFVVLTFLGIICMGVWG
jgi:hypothetical protein